LPEDKQEAILQDLRDEARKMKNGIIKVEFKIHEGEISLGEIIEARKKLG
jgi:hypothetical protein